MEPESGLGDSGKICINSYTSIKSNNGFDRDFFSSFDGIRCFHVLSPGRSVMRLL